jgi:hypothetical protein
MERRSGVRRTHLVGMQVSNLDQISWANSARCVHRASETPRVMIRQDDSGSSNGSPGAHTRFRIVEWKPGSTHTIQAGEPRLPNF